MPLRYGWSADTLPKWPFALPFVGYPVAWFMGVGDLIWPIAALIMFAVLARARGVTVPRVGIVWFLFLAWVLCSFVAINTFGRTIGAVYRFTLYAAATVMAVYLFNSIRTLTVRYVTGVATFFLAVMTAGGYFAMVAPLFTFVTPLYSLVPASLRSNDIIAEMIVRRTTQWNPDAWIVQAPRPSAPFIYANAWGNVYSLVLPLAVVYLTIIWKTNRRLAVLGLLIASLVPAAATLNRGMYIGLGVVGLWYLVQTYRRGAVRTALLATFGAGLVGLAVALSPFGGRLVNRVSTSTSTEDRADLYSATVAEVLRSPLLGYGAPRPSPSPWFPSLGTQGQLWTVLFSHGFLGAALFIAFLVLVWVRAIRRCDPVGAVLGGVVLATIVESTYYGMMTGLNVSLVAVALLERSDSQLRRWWPLGGEVSEGIDRGGALTLHQPG
ncbi:MAG: O-antigen ligase family protein [Tessaracoccus sp.]|uniref:O-antigen ligase family protein n=1 Tax=Tessaracoccus sp. TaxID=1971211 RepID=UPI001EB9D1AB|nr:O-antigen ligase family protein [Tessaracoccus sp.]MBK7822194.1 O-antigen ligase family protein [Tessaracoccus sp.]